jgi:hypothetical protein
MHSAQPFRRENAMFKIPRRIPLVACIFNEEPGVLIIGPFNGSVEVEGGGGQEGHYRFVNSLFCRSKLSGATFSHHASVPRFNAVKSIDGRMFLLNQNRDLLWRVGFWAEFGPRLDGRVLNQICRQDLSWTSPSH